MGLRTIKQKKCEDLDRRKREYLSGFFVNILMKQRELSKIANMIQ